MHSPKRIVAILVLLAVALPTFVFFVPVMYIPTSDHTECRNFGAYCQHVAQYGSLSYFYLCTGTIYQTDGSYWIGNSCMHF